MAVHTAPANLAAHGMSQLPGSSHEESVEKYIGMVLVQSQWRQRAVVARVLPEEGTTRRRRAYRYHHPAVQTRRSGYGAWGKPEKRNARAFVKIIYVQCPVKAPASNSTETPRVPAREFVEGILLLRHANTRIQPAYAPNRFHRSARYTGLVKEMSAPAL